MRIILEDKMAGKNYYVIVKEGEKIVKVDLKNKIAITNTKARVKLYPTRKEAVEFYKKWMWPITAMEYYTIKRVWVEK
jgi:hypothetical protein